MKNVINRLQLHVANLRQKIPDEYIIAATGIMLVLLELILNG